METRDEALAAWLGMLPKAERHLHLEGAFRWATVREAHPDGARLPRCSPFLKPTAVFADFAAFLGVFRDLLQPATGTATLVERHTYEVIEDLAEQRVVYAEITVGPPFHMARGLSLDEVFEALGRGKRAAEADCGVRVDFLLGLQRHDSPAKVRRYFEKALALAGPGGLDLLAGIDLQGDERIGATSAHAAVFEAARAAGLRVRAHAGELRGSAGVREAMDPAGLGPLEQLAHGVRACEDKGLLEELARAGVVLHVCPSSNVRLGVCSSYRTHPLPRLLAAGCRVTLNSDDPLLFGTTISREYGLAVTEMGCSRKEVATMLKTAFEASALSAEEVAGPIQELASSELALGKIDVRSQFPLSK